MGSIHYVRGAKFEVTTDRFIYFYNIDPDTLLPEMDKCMYNFMGCTCMLVGPKSQNALSFKSNQIGFTTYRRKHHHGFVAKVSNDSFDGCETLGINSRSIFMVTHHQEIRVYCQNTYAILDTILVPFNPIKRTYGEKGVIELEIISFQMSIS